jgi:hypothetical protein
VPVGQGHNALSLCGKDKKNGPESPGGKRCQET